MLKDWSVSVGGVYERNAKPVKSSLRVWRNERRTPKLRYRCCGPSNQADSTTTGHLCCLPPGRRSSNAMRLRNVGSETPPGETRLANTLVGGVRLERLALLECMGRIRFGVGPLWSFAAPFVCDACSCRLQLRHELARASCIILAHQRH